MDLVMTTLAFLLLAVSPAIQAQESRAPIPEPPARKEAQKLVREVFKEEYARSSPADRLALARKLLQQGVETTNDPAAQYELLQEARSLAADAGDVATSLRAVDELSRRYRVEPAGLKLASLTSVSLRARLPEDMSAVVNHLLQLVDEALALPDLETAEKACSLAQSVARNAKSIPLLNRADLKSKEIAALRVSVAALQKARETLVKSPEDPGANLIIGKHLCWTSGDWKTGLPHLAKGSEAALKAIASRELAEPKEPADQLALADSWWDLGEQESGAGRQALRTRAAFWYASAIPGLTGLNRIKAERRLEAVPGANTRINLLALIDPRKDAVAGTWEVRDQALISPSALAFAQLQIPYRPPEEYDVEMVVENRGAGYSIDIGLAVGERQFTVVLDGWDATVTGLYVLDGAERPKDATAVYSRIFTDAKPRTVVCSVRKTGVGLTIDGKRILEWRGDFKRLSNHPAWRIPDKGSLFVGSWTCYRISRLDLIPITGEGRRLR